MEIAGWNGNTTIWAPSNGAGATIKTSLDKSSWNNISQIPSNYSGTIASANVVVNRGATVYYVGGTVAIPANSTLVLLAKDTSLYLEEGDVLQANVSANTSISMSAGYELIAS